MPNNKSRKMLVFFCIVLVALLLFSKHLYNTTIPEMLPWVALFFSNCIVLLVGIFLVMQLNGLYVSENNPRRCRLGLLLIIAPFIFMLIFIRTDMYKVNFSILSAIPVDLENNSWHKSMLLPTFVSCVPTIGLSLISTLVSRSPDKDKDVQ